MKIGSKSESFNITEVWIFDNEIKLYQVGAGEGQATSHFVNKCWDFRQSCGQNICRCKASPRLQCVGLFSSGTTWVETRKPDETEHHNQAWLWRPLWRTGKWLWNPNKKKWGNVRKTTATQEYLIVADLRKILKGLFFPIFFKHTFAPDASKAPGRNPSDYICVVTPPHGEQSENPPGGPLLFIPGAILAGCSLLLLKPLFLEACSIWRTEPEPEPGTLSVRALLNLHYTLQLSL